MDLPPVNPDYKQQDLPPPNQTAQSSDLPPPNPGQGSLEMAINALHPIKKVGNFTLDMLSYLDRPRNAIASGIKRAYGDVYKKEGLAGVIKRAMEIDAGGISSDPNLKSIHEQGLNDFLEGAKAGFTGKDFASVGQMITPEYRKAHPVLSAVGGFTGDVLSDPLNLANPFTPIVKGVKLASRTATKAAPGLAKLADNGILRAVNVNVGDMKTLKDLEGKYRDLATAARHQAIEGVKPWEKKLQSLSKELKMDPEELKRAIVAETETPGIATDTAIQDQAIALRLKNQQQLRVEQSLGLPTKELNDYFPHVATPEGLKAIEKADRSSIFKPQSPKHASMKARTFLGTIEEVNSSKPYGVNKFFFDDPVVAQTVRDVRHTNSVNAALFLKQAAEDIGVKAENAPAHFVESNNPMLKGYMFPKAVAKELDRSYSRMTNQDEIGAFLKNIYDPAQRWWKVWSLGARPAYHLRNVIGNAWNNHLAGVSDPLSYAKAASLQSMARAGKFVGKVNGIPASKLWKEAERHGVIGKGQYGADIVDSIVKEINDANHSFKIGQLVTPSTKNIFLNAGFRIGSNLENNARLAHFIKKIETGLSYEDAAKSVKKYLFDYADLSNFEQKTLKRFMPFYTWSRKNIPLQLESIVLSPEKFNQFNIAKNQAEMDVRKPNPKDVPAYMRDRGPVYYGRTPAGDLKAFTLAGYLPLMDIQNLANPGDLMTGMISPLIKEPIEQWKNYDIFRRQAIQKYGGQTTDFLGVRMPVRLVHLMKNLIMLNELDRTNPGDIFGKNIVDKYGIRHKARSFGMKKEVGVETPVGKFAVGTERLSRTDLPKSERWFQYFTGAKTVPIDTEKGRARRMMLMKKDINQLRFYLKQAARRGNDRSVDEIKQQLDEFMKNHGQGE